MGGNDITAISAGVGSEETEGRGSAGGVIAASLFPVFVPLLDQVIALAWLLSSLARRISRWLELCKLT